MSDCEDVSVILVNFNHARFLPRSIEAILNQTVRPRELLIVDDSSTDDSMEVIGSYARRDAAIKVYRNERNLGVVETFNRHLKKCRSQYVVPASADDYLLPAMIEKSMSVLRKYPQAGMSSAWHTTFEEINGLVRANPVPWNCDAARYYSPDELVESITPPGIPSHPAVIKREEFERSGGWKESLHWHGDWFFNLTVAFRSGICYVPESLAVFRVVPSSYSASGARGTTQLDVIAETLRLVLSPEYADILPHFRDSGVLRYFGPNLVRAATRFPERHSPAMLRLVSCLSDEMYAELLEDPDVEARNLAELFFSRTRRRDLRDRIDRAAAELARVEGERDQARAEVQWMRSSKFWELRGRSMALKQSINRLMGRTAG